MKQLQLAIVVAALAAASSARASITLTFNNVSPVQTVTLNASGGVNINNQGVYAGIYNLTVNGVATPSLCIDIARDISAGQTFNDYSYSSLAAAPLSPSGPMGPSAASDIEKLWAAYYSSSMNDASGVTAAALQVAIWEDIGAKAGTYSLTVSDNSSVTTEAAVMLNSLSSLTATADLVGLVSQDGQNYVVAVPEPATMIAGALLLLPLGASTLRILRKSRTA